MVRAYAPMLVVLCVLAPYAAAENLVANPDFDEGLAHWTARVSGNASVVLDTANGSPQAPSARIYGDALSSGAGIVSDCIAMGDSSPVDLVVNFQGDSSGLTSFGLDVFDDSACTIGSTAIRSTAYRSGDWGTWALRAITLPAGTQGVQIVLDAGSLGYGPSARFDHVQFSRVGEGVEPINLNQEGLTGTWYNPATSGQGIQLQFSADDARPGNGSLFGAWFTYDVVSGSTGAQRWYSIQSAIGGDASRLPFNIYRNVGGNFDAPPSTSVVPVGRGIMNLQSCSVGTFAYVLDDGRSGTMPIERLLPNVDCVDTGGLPPNPPSDFGLSGAWYNAETSGQGIMAEVNPADGQVFLGWYTYAANGESSGVTGERWFSAQGSHALGSRTIPLTIYVSTGGIFDSDSTAQPVHTVAVGTGTLTYSNCDSATFDYVFLSGELQGKSGTIPLARVAATPLSCSDD